MSPEPWQKLQAGASAAWVLWGPKSLLSSASTRSRYYCALILNVTGFACLSGQACGSPTAKERCYGCFDWVGIATQQQDMEYLAFLAYSKGQKVRQFYFLCGPWWMARVSPVSVLLRLQISECQENVRIQVILCLRHKSETAFSYICLVSGVHAWINCIEVATINKLLFFQLTVRI